MSIEKKTTVSVYISIEDGLSSSELEQLRIALCEKHIDEITCKINEDGDGVTLNFTLE